MTKNNVRFRNLIQLFLLVSSLSNGPLFAAMNGELSLQSASGDKQTASVRLEIPPKWEGPISLQTPTGTIKTPWFHFLKNRVAIAFTGIPGEAAGTTFVFVGDYGTKQFSGKVFRGRFPIAQTKAELGDSLTSLLKGADAVGFEARGTFAFGGNKPAPETRKMLPGPGGQRYPLYTTRPLDPNNPCPNGPCWSTGGVGRHAEFYSGGPIQNPGH